MKAPTLSAWAFPAACLSAFAAVALFLALYVLPSYRAAEEDRREAESWRKVEAAVQSEVDATPPEQRVWRRSDGAIVVGKRRGQRVEVKPGDPGGEPATQAVQSDR